MPLEPQQIHSLKEVITNYSVLRQLLLLNIAGTSVPIVFDEVQCTGVEGSLGECEFVTDHDCDHSEEAGVICIGNLIFQLYV